MHRSVTPIALLTALLACAVTQADPPSVTTSATVNIAALQVSFQSIDRNNDHRISKTEAGTFKSLIDNFARLDTDGDGFISEAEFAAARTTQSPLQ